MAHPSNIIVLRTGTTSEIIFHIYTFAQIYLYTTIQKKTSERLSDSQILKVRFDSRGMDLHDFPLVYYFVHHSFSLF